MKFIIFILKLSLDAVRDTVKVVKYFNLIKHNNFSFSFFQIDEELNEKMSQCY